MRKNLIIIFIVLLVIVSALGFYLIAPAFQVVEVEESSPLDAAQFVPTGPTTADELGDDPLAHMDEETKARFLEEMDKAKDERITELEEAPESGVLAMGPFEPRAHEVEGEAFLIAKDGKQYVRFEDFFTINGPNLHIYLASDLAANDFIDLGPIKATRGSVNYEIPPGTDTERYDKVLVWCVPFRVLFSYADLE